MVGAVHRECGVHERYSVARNRYGSPPVVTLAAVLSSPLPTPSATEAILSHLRARVESILEVSPVLGCGVIQTTSTRPRLRSLEPAPSARDIVVLREGREVGGDVVGGQDGGGGENDDGPQAALRRVRNESMTSEQGLLIAASIEDLAAHALWTVALVPVVRTRPQPEHGSAFIVVASFNHVLLDGKATFNVFHALLSAAAPPTDHGIIAPASDEVFDLDAEPAPDPRLDEETKAAPVWPNQVRANLLECPIGLRTVDLDAAFTPALKAVAASHGIRTIHPVLEAAAVFALSLAVHGGEGQGEQDGTYAMATSTAISLRGSVEEHGHYGGNYVGGRGGRVLCKPHLLFWDYAAHVAAQLASPAVLKAAMSLWKGLAALPSSTGQPVSPPAYDAIDGEPLEEDGWAPYFAQAVSLTPSISTFQASIGISNLGFLPLDCDGDGDGDDALFSVHDCCWTQTASPIADAIIANIMGCGRARSSATRRAKEGVTEPIAEGSAAAATSISATQPTASQAVPDLGGLSIGITYRQGSVDEAILVRFQSYLRRLLLLLAAGSIGKTDDVAAIRAKLA